MGWQCWSAPRRSANGRPVRTLLIIPAFNEAACITGVLISVRQHFSGDIVVIDDGSEDDTAELASADIANTGSIGALQAALEEGALAIAPEAVILSGAAPRLVNTSCIAVPGAKAETLVIGLDLGGVAVSAGSACSSGKVEASHVLRAMGVAPELAQGAIRVSLGIGTTSHDIDRFLGAFGELIKRLEQSPKAAA